MPHPHPTDQTDADLAAENAMLRAENAELRRLAYTDPLTGLYNRRWLFANWSTATAGKLAVMFDVDHFKRYNNVHGHAAGDAVLAAIGRDLTAHGTGVRLSGDELLMFTDRDTIKTWKAQWPVLLPGGGRVTVTGTVGITPALADPTETLRRVDVAMYAGKRSRRGTRTWWTEDLDPTVPPAAGTDRRRNRGVLPGDPYPHPTDEPKPFNPGMRPAVTAVPHAA